MAPVRRTLRSALASGLGPTLACPALAALLLLTGAAAHAAGAPVLRHPLAFDPASVTLQEGSQGARVSMRGAALLEEADQPRLPYQMLSFALPQGTRVESVAVRGAKWQPLGSAHPLQKAGPLGASDGGWVQLHDLKPEAGVFPPVVARAVGAGMLRGYGVASVQVFPVRTDARGALELLTSGTLELTLAPAAPADVALRRVAWAGRAQADAALVASTVVNDADLAANAPQPGIPAELMHATAEGKAGATPQLQPEQALPPALLDATLPGIEYLIVTPAALAPEFQRLADAKTARGIPAAVLTVEWITANYRAGGDEQETIRNVLKHAYQDWGTSYVLLGGDTDVLPARIVRSRFYPQGGYTDMPVDLYFAALDGNWNSDADGWYGEAAEFISGVGDGADMLAELAVGRAPVSTLAEAAVFVDKTLAYQAPVDPAAMGRALFLSEVLFPQQWDGVLLPTLDGATYSEAIINNSIIDPANWIESYRLYENNTPYFGAVKESKAAAVDSMNTGRFGLVHHIGHGFYYNMSVGDLNIFAMDADQLFNAPTCFVLYALNCSSGAYDVDCLLERFLQNPDGGSVVSIGSSRAAFPTTADRYEQAFYEQVFVLGNTAVGDAIAASRASWAAAASTVESVDRWTHMTYTLLGDPELRMWRMPPVAAGVTVPASVTLGASSVSVTVLRAGLPLADARVALRKVGEDYAVGFTDGGGQAVIPFRPLTTGSIAVTVSGAGILPYSGSIQVLPAAAAHVRAVVEALDDDALAPSDGNGDGRADSGETVAWAFRFTNNGGAPANNVAAVLRVLDAPGATIPDSTVTVGNLAPAANVAPADRFVVALDATVEDGARLRFDLVTTSGVTQWHQEVTLVAYAPEMDLVRLTVDDATTGNGDGIIQAGELIRLVMSLRNLGAGTSTAITGSLSTSSGNVSLVDAADTWAPLGELQAAAGSGGFQVSESNVAVENPITLTLQDGRGHVWTHDLELRPPPAPGLPELDTSVSSTGIAVRCAVDPPTHLLGFRVYRSLSPIGPFTEATLDPLQRTGYFLDSGLQQLTKYYYYATTVDSSRIESGPSPVAFTSTAPPELSASGYPIELALEVAGHIAVGDVLGDGSLVAVVGSADLCAYKPDGTELVDGDGDSQTLGPISAQGDRFTPAGITLANLDADPGLEMIGSSWNSFQTFIFNADGSPLPGWPKQMNQKNWATPAVGDLDGNGDLEIVVNNVAGLTYVWNHDGTEFFNGDGNAGTQGVFHVRTGENFGRSSPALFDVNGDGKLEIIFGTHYRNGTSNRMHALQNNGTDAPGWPRLFGSTGYILTSPTVADLDKDGTKEIMFACDNDSLYVVRPNGQNFPGFPIRFTSQAGELDSMTPSPAVGDFDSDGDLEMVVVEIFTIHECRIHLKDHNGVTRPGWPRVLPGLSEASPVIADIDGDQQLDVVFGIGGDSDNDPSQLYALHADGTDIAGFPITLGGAPRGAPTICDFNQDGMVDIVLAAFDRKLHVWTMPYPFNEFKAPWPTFRGNVYRTGVFGDHTATGVDQPPPSGGTAVARRLTLHPNVPNPFNPSTHLRFSVPPTGAAAVPVRVEVLDLAGRRVRLLLAQPLAAGEHELSWDGRDDLGRTVGSGVYFTRVEAGGDTRTLKMTLVK